ncbi:hypothetical protein FB45DRAFT_881219 [Roridomyces roridus]|uniref:Uncharacterized protein n=1 Tax=Roridomyces roridus TaxID=1738132 RepID=A0AAD7F5Z6_9AGAR|nr:hypothetical protein FB45DRAFT_881219 [Roridomyces roridus]
MIGTSSTLKYGQARVAGRLRDVQGRVRRLMVVTGQRVHGSPETRRRPRVKWRVTRTGGAGRVDSRRRLQAHHHPSSALSRHFLPDAHPRVFYPANCVRPIGSRLAAVAAIGLALRPMAADVENLYKALQEVVRWKRSQQEPLPTFKLSPTLFEREFWAENGVVVELLEEPSIIGSASLNLTVQLL